MIAYGKYLVGIVLLISIYSVTSQLMPASYYGNVTRDGVEAPMGTNLTVWIDGEEMTYSAYLSRVKGIYGPHADLDPSAPYLTVPADNGDTEEKDGGVWGDTIVFKINGFSADQTATWYPGNIDNIDLTCTNCDHAPELNGSVSPSTGYESTTFTFTANYVDEDNDAPSWLNVDVSGEPHDITGTFSDATTQTEYKDGKSYSVEVSDLSLGTHTYMFSGSDGFLAASSDVMDGPTVYDRVSINLEQDWNLISIPFEPA